LRKGKKTIVNALVLLSPATTVLSAMLTLLRIFGRRGGKAERILDGPIYEEKRGDPEPKSETEQQQG